MKRAAGLTLAAGLLGTVVLANWLTTRFHFVPVGFGFEATAGTFAAGFALAFRDGVQDLLGRRVMLGVIALGAALSWLVADPFIALASGVAFLLAELANWLIYTPLRNRSRLGDRRWAAAVVTSNAAGTVIDTVVFLSIAFGWAAVLPALAGQLVGKGWATLTYLLLGKGVARCSTPATPADPECVTP
jgi:queuosine precursor transporter